MYGAAVTGQVRTTAPKLGSAVAIVGVLARSRIDDLLKPRTAVKAD